MLNNEALETAYVSEDVIVMENTRGNVEQGWEIGHRIKFEWLGTDI